MLTKMLAAGTIVLTLAGAGVALAAHGSREGRAFRPTAEDAAAFTDARIAAFKAGLELNADQAKNWPAVETAIRDLAKQRAARVKERADRRAARRQANHDGDASANAPRQARADALERLRRRGDAMTTRGAALTKLADAAEPLYNSLDDGQKRRFGLMLRMGLRHAAGHHRHHHWQRRADNDRHDGDRNER